MSVHARGYSGVGWYIVEDARPGMYLRDWRCFPQAAQALRQIKELYADESCIILWWDGTAWSNEP